MVKAMQDNCIKAFVCPSNLKSSHESQMHTSTLPR